MTERAGLTYPDKAGLRGMLGQAWEWLITVQAAVDEESARLGRLFNILMVIGFGILIVLFAILVSTQPLGLTAPSVTRIAAAFPFVFIGFSVFCLLLAKRGYVRPVIRLYVAVNLITIAVVVWLFDGVYSPAWVLFFWTVTISGVLLTPSSALWMSTGVVVYFMVLLVLTRTGLYVPPLTFGIAGREFVNIGCVLIVQISTVGLLTWLNMRSLREALGGLRDRTRQLMEAQEELVRKEKLAVLGQVAGSVGHELRNPLGVMSNAVYYLQTILQDADATTREYLDILKSEIAGSERIVSDLLGSVRTKPPQPETVWVAELVGQSLGKLVIPASVDVKLDIPPTVPPVRVDAQQIQQVLRNLIINGIDAMQGGGTLRIGAKADKAGGKVILSVEDSGTGIAPEQMDKLFQPLYTTKARGTGLGLIVVKNLTEANGGRVDVKSEPGKGALFLITLPCIQNAGAGG